MISGLLQSLYTKVFINIVVGNLKTFIYVEVCSKKSVLKNFHKNFDTTSMNPKIQEFIQPFIKESPFYYISILDNSASQGAAPTCLVSEMNKFFDAHSAEHRCFLNNWTYYTSEYDLEAIKHTYRSIGIDFIFSPFVMLAKFYNDKIEKSLAIFVLIEESYLSFTVFDNSKLLYAEYLSMQHHKDSDELMIDSSQDDTFELEGINLEEVDLDNDSMVFDDFANIEELDDSDTLDEFSQADEPLAVDEKPTDISNSGFNEDYQRFSLIKSALSTFYKDPKYESKFIETIYIADGAGVSGDLKNYLEEELYLGVHIRKIDLGLFLCELTKAELNEI